MTSLNKKFHVQLSYRSLKSPQKVEIEAVNMDTARISAQQKYPNAEILGPGAVVEVTGTGNCVYEREYHVL